MEGGDCPNPKIYGKKVEVVMAMVEEGSGGGGGGCIVHGEEETCNCSLI